MPTVTGKLQTMLTLQERNTQLCGMRTTEGIAPGDASVILHCRLNVIREHACMCVHIRAVAD